MTIRNKKNSSINVDESISVFSQDQIPSEELFTSLGEITSHIIHELKNPLGVISGYIKLLEQDIHADDSRLTYLQKIKDGAFQLEDILNEVLLFTQPKARTILTADLKAEINKIISLVKINNKIKFSKRYPADTVPVRMSPVLFHTLIRKIFEKLNAVDNFINIMIERIDKERLVNLRIGVRKKNNKSFSPFKEVTLSMFQKIIELHHGCLTFDLENTTITISLPLNI